MGSPKLKTYTVLMGDDQIASKRSANISFYCLITTGFPHQLLCWYKLKEWGGTGWKTRMLLPASTCFCHQVLPLQPPPCPTLPWTTHEPLHPPPYLLWRGQVCQWQPCRAACHLLQQLWHAQLWCVICNTAAPFKQEVVRSTVVKAS